MTDEVDAERLRGLTGLAIEALEAYGGGLRALGPLVDSIKVALRSAEGFVSGSWFEAQTRLWGQLEIIRALALDEGRQQLRLDEESDARQIVASLLKAFRTLA